VQNGHACQTVLLNKIKNLTSGVAGMNAKGIRGSGDYFSAIIFSPQRAQKESGKKN